MKDKTRMVMYRSDIVAGNRNRFYASVEFFQTGALRIAAASWCGYESRRKHPRQRGGNLSRNALTGRAPVVYSMMSAYGQLRLHPLNTVVYEEMVWYSALDSKTVAARAREVK